MSLISDVITQQYPKMLQNLSHWLDKGAAFADSKKFNADVLLNARLAPDQFHLTRQVQIACDNAVGAAARLAGRQPARFEDNEKTLPELKARIEKAIANLKAYSAQDFAGFEERRITMPWWEGRTMSGYEFLVQYTQPNFYFHLTTAYSILRHHGVDVGKMDFLGQLPLQKP